MLTRLKNITQEEIFCFSLSCGSCDAYNIHFLLSAYQDSVLCGLYLIHLQYQAHTTLLSPSPESNIFTDHRFAVSLQRVQTFNTHSNTQESDLSILIQILRFWSFNTHCFAISLQNICSLKPTALGSPFLANASKAGPPPPPTCQKLGRYNPRSVIRIQLLLGIVNVSEMFYTIMTSHAHKLLSNPFLSSFFNIESWCNHSHKGWAYRTRSQSFICACTQASSDPTPWRLVRSAMSRFRKTVRMKILKRGSDKLCKSHDHLACTQALMHSPIKTWRKKYAFRFSLRMKAGPVPHPPDVSQTAKKESRFNEPQNVEALQNSDFVYMQALFTFLS